MRLLFQFDLSGCLSSGELRILTALFRGRLRCQRVTFHFEKAGLLDVPCSDCHLRGVRLFNNLKLVRAIVELHIQLFFFVVREGSLIMKRVHFERV